MAAPRGQKIIRRDADGKAYVAGGGKGGDPSHKARSALASEVRHSQSKSEIAAQERSVDAAALRDDDVASAFEGKGLLLSIEAQLVDLKADVHLLRVHVLGKRGSLAKTESKPEVTMELCRAATASVLSSKPSIFSTRYAPRSWISAAELILKAVGGNGALKQDPPPRSSSSRRSTTTRRRPRFQRMRAARATRRRWNEADVRVVRNEVESGLVPRGWAGLPRSPAAQQQQPAQHHDAATTEIPADARGEGDEETVE